TTLQVRPPSSVCSTPPLVVVQPSSGDTNARSRGDGSSEVNEDQCSPPSSVARMYLPTARRPCSGSGNEAYNVSRMPPENAASGEVAGWNADMLIAIKQIMQMALDMRTSFPRGMRRPRGYNDPSAVLKYVFSSTLCWH